MRFPAWIEEEPLPEVRARLKLRHALSAAALHKFGRTSMHDLARGIDCSHGSIFNAIARGSFSRTMAAKIESFFGSNEIRADFLISPLSTEQSTVK